MKYTCRIEVPLNRDDCIKLWLDETQFDKWQEGFQYKKWTKGESNENNSTSNILILQGKRKIELEELIINNNLPDSIEGKYVHIHMTNTQKVSFEYLASQKTMIRSDVEYIKFNAFIPKMMAKFFPSLFKKQSQKWLDQFKLLAEQISG
jgi:hypothetical protein